MVYHARPMSPSPIRKGSPNRRRSPSISPRRRSPFAGRDLSPKPFKRSRSPVQRRSPMRRRSRSPMKRSPVRRRSRSPIRRGRSPVRKQRSPVRRRSPAKSGIYHKKSPVNKTPPRRPARRERSPVRRNGSPVHRNRDASPARRNRSPVRRARSPPRNARTGREAPRNTASHKHSDRRLSPGIGRDSRRLSPDHVATPARHRSPRRPRPSPIRSHRPPPRVEYDPETRLFVGGLNFMTDGQRLIEVFSRFGTIVKEPGTKRSKGFGFVNFETKEATAKAIAGYAHNHIHLKMLKEEEVTEEEKKDLAKPKKIDGRVVVVKISEPTNKKTEETKEEKEEEKEDVEEEVKEEEKAEETKPVEMTEEEKQEDVDYSE